MIINHVPGFWKMAKLAFVAILLSSCAGNKNESTDEGQLLETDVVMRVDSSSSYFFRPFMMDPYIITDRVYGDEKLWISEIIGDSLISRKGLLRHGNGPGEVISIDVIPGNDNSIFVFNCGGGIPVSLFRIPIPEAVENSGKWDRYPLDSISGLRATTFSGAQLSDSTLLVNSASYGQESIFSILDFKNKSFKELKWMPGDGSDLPPIVRQGIYMDNSNIFGGDGRYLYVCGEGSYSFIFRPSGDSVEIIKTITDSYPSYSAMEDGLNYTVQRTTAQLNATVTRNHIYLLELDSTVEGMTPPENYPREYGSRLTVYDWDGNETARYNLDRMGRRIMVTDDDSTLYLLGADPDSSDDFLARYRLK